MKLRVGQTLTSPVDTITVVVTRAPQVEVEVTCAGVPLFDAKAGGPAPEGSADPSQMEGTQLGKRYGDEDLELLCSKAGQGTLAVNGAQLPLREAKPLPASD